jgi:hypothetical protein
MGPGRAGWLALARAGVCLRGAPERRTPDSSVRGRG